MLVEMFSGTGAVPYLIVVIYMLSTGLGLPWPEEIAIVAVGVLAAKGQMDPWLGLSALLVGGILGDILMYWVGYHFGMRVIREHPRLAKHLTPEREAAIEEKLKAHGFKVLFLSRFLIGIRGSVYITAGILKYKFRRFLMIDLFCATLVIALFFTLSYFLGDRVFDMIRQGEMWFTITVVTAIVIALAIWWWRHRKHKQRVAAGEEPADEDSEIARLAVATAEAGSGIVVTADLMDSTETQTELSDGGSKS